MLELLLAFFFGMISVLSPCILPVVPLIFAGSRGRATDAFLVVLGLIVSMLVAGYVAFLASPFLKAVAFLFMLLFSLILLSDELEARTSVLVSKITSVRLERLKSMPSFFFGIFLAFLWLPCILPLTVAALGQTVLAENPLVMLSYGLGMALAIALILKAGERFLKANLSFVRKLSGLVVLLYLIYFALAGVLI